MMACMAYDTPFSCNEVTKAKIRFSSSQYLIFFVSEKREMYLINSKSPKIKRAERKSRSKSIYIFFSASRRSFFNSFFSQRRKLR